jgi:hypothetical protein
MRTSQSRLIGFDRSRTLSACIAFALLSACTKPAPETTTATAAPTTTTATSNMPSSESANELKWARLALARNPTLEIIATDTAAGVFTVRFKDTGEVRAVKADELAATPLSALTASVRTPAAEPAAAATATPAAAPQASTAAPSTAAAPADARVADATPTSSNYTIERADGQLKISGPGVSIVSSGSDAVAANANSAGQRGADPIICEGRRMLHFDNRNIYVEGDAIIARGGCELYITNSRVVADGTGIVVRDAVVHIANSTIEGGAASFDADDTSKMYLRSSTFQGLPRRSERATVQDQGGNQWR